MEREAFAGLIQTELDRAYRLAGLLLGRDGDAEDVTHDAVLRAWAAAGSLRDPDRFQPWFDRIVVNACRDRLRRNRRIRFVPLDAASDLGGSDDPFVRLIDADAMLAAISRLDFDLKAVVILRFWADLTVDQIAARVQAPPGTVKSRLHRGLAQLRTAVDEPTETEVAT